MKKTLLSPKQILYCADSLKSLPPKEEQFLNDALKNNNWEEVGKSILSTFKKCCGIEKACINEQFEKEGSIEQKNDINILEQINFSPGVLSQEEKDMLSILLKEKSITKEEVEKYIHHSIGLVVKSAQNGLNFDDSNFENVKCLNRELKSKRLLNLFSNTYYFRRFDVTTTIVSMGNNYKNEDIKEVIKNAVIEGKEKMKEPQKQKKEDKSTRRLFL